MSTPTPAAGEPRAGDPADFSLALGGPLYQLWRRTRLAGDGLQLAHRRIVALTLFAWAPLLALSGAEGHAWGGSVALPFLQDVEVNVRLQPAVSACVSSVPCVACARQRARMRQARAKREAVTGLLRCLTTNRDRMRDETFRAAGYRT